MNYLWNNRLKSIVGTALLVAACGDTSSTDLKPTDTKQPQPEPTIGQSSFVSADGQNGDNSRSQDNSANNDLAGAPEADGADDRTVEEGDIYRVTTDGKLLNLNSYRGLQIIDMADPTNPVIMGRVEVAGYPVEMYQVGTRVYMLLNDYQGYYGSRTDILPASYQGGLVMVVDISDPTNPRVTGRAEVPGNIQTSRLTRGNNKEALYVVAQDWSNGSTTKVKSFSVSTGGKLQAKTDIDLGGYVQDIQATGERLMVARWDWNQNNQGSQVSVIDISSEDGAMVEGQSITVKGRVAKKTNMDMHNDVLRVVSGNNWSSNTNTNHIQTFDATDIQNLTVIDEKTFGPGEDLFATLFLGNKAFFVTYLRVDPFHAFEITDAGLITEKSEFIVSGWNDFFKPVEADTRLVGIGINDENGRKLAVSLYDVSDLTNQSPMLAREEIDLDWGWSEANWDDRAFTVVEKGTSVLAADGVTLETGLVLLPFQGWDSQSKEYISAVQIFTFSKTTLTARGLMNHGDPVRRSFVADQADNTVGNLSDQELQLHDATLPDSPVALGSVALAPDYADFIVIGNYGLRRQNRQGYYSWWGGNATQNPTDDVQVVSLAGNVDEAAAIAEIQVPAYAQMTLVGDTLVVSNQRLRVPNDYNSGFDTDVQLWDMSDPTVPILASTKTYADLPVTGYYDYYWGWGGGVGIDDCFDCTVARFNYWGGQYGPLAVGDSIVYPEVKQESEVIGTVKTTNYYPSNYDYDRCYDRNTGDNKACTYTSGGIYCSQTTLTDGTQQAQVCQGAFYTCTQDADGQTDCVDVEMSTVPHETNTYNYQQSRYWYHYDLHVLNVANPAQPGALHTISMAQNEEAVSLLPKADSLYVSFKKPIQVPGDARPFVAYQMRRIDMSNPAVPVVKPDVNIPGELLDVEGTTLITRDFLWGQNIVESSINKLKLQGNQAFLQGVRRFQDKLVEDVQLDGSTRLLLTERNMWDYYGYSNNNDYTLRLNVLDLNNATLPVLATEPIDTWASLKSAINGRALFTIPGGLLVVNLDDVTAPFAQAYFPTKGWPRAFEATTTSVYFAAGPYGVFSFDLDEFNLLTPAP